MKHRYKRHSQIELGRLSRMGERSEMPAIKRSVA
jgi:hypothetical protein